MAFNKKSRTLETSTKLFDLPSGSGDLILYLSKSLTKLISLEGINEQEMELVLIESCKNLTSSGWVEILIKEDERLKVLGEKQNKDYIDINSHSLPGFVAEKNIYQIINNPRTSGFYLNFTDKIMPFSLTSNSMEEPNSVCAVPIYAQDFLSVKGVIMLYNKTDQKKAQSFYTVNDVLIVQSIGLLALETIKAKKIHMDYKAKTALMLSTGEENHFIQLNSNQMLKRQNLLKKCQKLIKKEMNITEDLFILMNECLESQAGVLYINSHSELVPVTTFGIDSDIDKRHMIKTKTSEYSGFTAQSILSIKDLRSEPLWSVDINYKSLISCPIFDERKILLGSIEFFRKDSSFNEIDQQFAKSLLKALGKIPRENWENIRYPDVSPGAVNVISIATLSLHCFSLCMNRFYDFTKLFNQAKCSIKRLINYDNCTIYIADQKRMALWTAFSDRQEAISYPLTPDSLLGSTYFTEKPLILPTRAPLKILDLDQYRDSSVLSIPILGNLTQSRVIGIILLRRTPHEFSSEEIDLLTNFSVRFSTVLDNLFASYLFVDYSPIDVSKHFSCPNLEFRRLNSSRSLNSDTLERSNYNSRSNETSDISNVTSKNASIEIMFNIDQIPIERQQKLANFKKMVESDGGNLVAFAKNLSKIIPSQSASLLLKDCSDGTLFNINNDSRMQSSGLIKHSVVENEIVLIRDRAFSNGRFDIHTDSLDISDRIESFMCIPISSLSSGVDGVICFVNSPDGFPPEDVLLAKYLSLISREILQMKVTTTNDWQTILKEGRKHKMLLRSIRQIYEVTNYAQHLKVLSANILRRLSTANEIEPLIQMALELIKSFTNSEDATAIYLENSSLVRFSIVEHKVCLIPNKKEEEFIKSIIEHAKPKIFKQYEGQEIMICIPYVKNEKALIIKTWNKKDETFGFYGSYTREDEIKITEIAKTIFAAITNENPDSKDLISELRREIRHLATSLDTQSLISTIRSVAQNLIDCDRATVFIREGEKLVVKSQGSEQEIPYGLEIPIGKGIVGYVAQTGQSENIKDVYDDSRFNNEVD